MGYVVLRYGVYIDLKKIEVIRNIWISKNVIDLWRFLGIMLYYWKFVKGFVEIVKCFYVLIKKNGVWNWMLECDYVFYEFWDKFIYFFIFGYLDVDGGLFVLDIDVSNDVIGCVLL